MKNNIHRQIERLTTLITFLPSMRHVFYCNNILSVYAMLEKSFA